MLVELSSFTGEWGRGGKLREAKCLAHSHRASGGQHLDLNSSQPEPTSSTLPPAPVDYQLRPAFPWAALTL